VSFFRRAGIAHGFRLKEVPLARNRRDRSGDEEGRMRAVIAFCLGVACLGIGADSAWSQTTRRAKPPEAAAVEPRKGDVNAWTIGLAGGLLEGSFIRYAADIAKVLDDGDNLRVIPLVTYGAVGNVSDLLYLKGVDAAITQADVLDHFKRELNVPRIEERIHYVSPLYHSEVHVCAHPQYKSLSDLKGRKVGFNTRGSAANLSGQIVFRRLNIDVEPVFVNNSIAIEQIRKGELAALVHVVGKPNDLFTSMKGEPACRLLPVEYNSALSDFYLPTSLKREDYPALIPSGEVPTVAVQTLLAVFNWPKGSERHRKVARFIDAYVAKFEQLQQAPHQPKWKEINIAAKVPGWTRYSAAEEALAKSVSGDEKQTTQLRTQFESFLNAQTGSRSGSLSQQEREALFGEFLKWQRR
jgi:TRAP-type uncharacterized transport system substrate-binding protein